MNELGSLIKKLRGKRPLREVAEQAGISHTYLSDLEKGVRRGSKTPVRPSPVTLMGLSKALSCPYESLMKSAGYLNEERDTRNQKDIKKILEESEVMFDGMPLDEEDKRRVEDVLTGLFWEAKEMNKRKKKDDTEKG